MISKCKTKKIATNARETLSSILKLAVAMRLIQINPASFTYNYPPATKADSDANGVWLTTFSQCYRVMEWAHSTLAGMPEEKMIVLGLDAENIHLDERFISIEQSWTEAEHGPELTPPKTPKAIRRIPMTDLYREVISTWDMTSGALILGKDGKRINPHTANDRISKVFKAARFEYGDPVPHLTQFSIRHSFDTSCINAGIEVSLVSRWVGHVDVTTMINRYVKQRMDGLYEAANAIDKAVRG